MDRHTDDLSRLAAAWPSPYVARRQKTLDTFSGGLLRARTLANLDSRGEGPPGRIRIGRTVAYPVAELVEWLRTRRTA